MVNDATAEQRQAMAEQARGIAEHFESITKSHKDGEKPNLYTAKVRRYKQYVRDKLVRVADDTHVLYSQWILKEQALQQCLEYDCPIQWLEARGINVNFIGDR